MIHHEQRRSLVQSVSSGVSLILICSLITGCAAAPRGAALRSEITSNRAAESGDYQIVPVDSPQITRQIALWPFTGSELELRWPEGQSGGDRSLKPGDTLTVNIWDTAPGSVITAGQTGMVTLAGVQISPDGSVFVPFAQDVQIAGLSPEAARKAIQLKLLMISPTAEVQLNVEAGDRNAIDLISGVSRPGRYPVADRSVSVLSMLAVAGGIPDAMRNPVIRVQRGGQAYAALASDLYRSPKLDIPLRGGDRVIVESDPRSFVIMGAAGVERTAYFEKASHNLLEAIALGSGLSEDRADIRAIMVLRKYRAVGSGGPTHPNVIFTFDLSAGSGLFAASNFKIHPDDVVLATESAIPSAHSLLRLFGTSLGIADRL